MKMKLHEGEVVLTSRSLLEMYARGPRARLFTALATQADESEQRSDRDDNPPS